MPVPIPFLFLIPHSLTTSGYFLFSVVGCDQGKPTSSSWNSLSHKGSQDHSSQPESGERGRQDVYRKWTTSLLYSASIKGNSVEYFLEGVIMSDGRSDETMHTHSFLPPSFHSVTWICRNIQLDEKSHIYVHHTDRDTETHTLYLRSSSSHLRSFPDRKSDSKWSIYTLPSCTPTMNTLSCFSKQLPPPVSTV